MVHQQYILNEQNNIKGTKIMHVQLMTNSYCFKPTGRAPWGIWSFSPYPVEGMSLAGDQDTDLSNDIQPSQIVCKNILQHTIQNWSWYIIIICMLGLMAVTSYDWTMSVH